MNQEIHYSEMTTLLSTLNSSLELWTVIAIDLNASVQQYGHSVKTAVFSSSF
jgi:hypothetical protein